MRKPAEHICSKNCLINNNHFRAQHVKGEVNGPTDALVHWWQRLFVGTELTQEPHPVWCSQEKYRQLSAVTLLPQVYYKGIPSTIQSIRKVSLQSIYLSSLQIFKSNKSFPRLFFFFFPPAKSWEAWSAPALISLNSLTHSQDLSLGTHFPHGSAQQLHRVVFIKNLKLQWQHSSEISVACTGAKLWRIFCIRFGLPE